jgi:GNAT superfamily N-acetyltransferase
MFEDDPSAEFRRARPEDAGEIRAMVRSAYVKYLDRVEVEPKPMLADYDAAVVRHQVWLLRRDGKPTAVLELIPEPDYLLVENVAVAPEAQGRGLGRRLMTFAEAEARRQGFAELRLYTHERFVENIALYLSLGYRETGRERLPQKVVVHMAKTLPPGQA